MADRCLSSLLTAEKTMSTNNSIDQSKKRRRTVLYTACPVAIIILILLLLRGCKKDEVRPQPAVQPQPNALFVPRELGTLEGLDRDGIISYCRKLPAAD